MPKVSIIVPNYNHEVYLEQRLESILNQTFQDFEIILLDDASSDGSQVFLKQFEFHPKVSCLLLNDTNSGSVFKQWVAGIEHSKGDFIWIAESDDYASPDFLEATLNSFGLNEELGMVFTDTQKVDKSGANLGLVSHSKKLLGSLPETGSIINKQNLSAYLIRQLVIVNASSVLFKKEALKGLDFNFLKQFKNTGDVFVYVGIALNHDVCFLPQPLNYMRLHDHNTTKKFKKSGRIYRDRLLMFDYYLNDFSAHAINKEDLLSFFKSNILFFADFNSIKCINSTVDRMVDFGLVLKIQGLKFKTVIYLYNKLTRNGGPHAIRTVFKYFIKTI